MIGLFYIVLIAIFGILTIYNFENIDDIFIKISDNDFAKKIPKALFYVPAGFTFGVSVATFLNYFLIYLSNAITKNNDIDYVLGTLLTIVLLIAGVFLNFKKFKKNREKTEEKDKKNIVYYSVITLFVFSFIAFIMIYSFRRENGWFRVGAGVAGDLALHTAMTSSFGVGGNIPTNYMFFSGAGIKWHFMFYFFCGILNYLGMPLDFAINIPSILFMLFAIMMISLLAVLFSKSKYAYYITPLLIFFRSSINGFAELIEYIKKGTPLMESIIKNKDWSSVMPYDSWGIYTLNVPTNQRHLMYGASVIIILVFLFLPYLREMLEELKDLKIKERLKKLAISKDSWRVDFKDKKLIIALVLVVTLPYFHGSALITALLILFGFAIFSKHRLSYLVIAISAILSSFIQTNIFSGGVGEAFKLTPHIGFVMEDVSALGFLKYVLSTCGLLSIILLLNIFITKGNRRFYLCLLASFIIPYIFAFIVQTSSAIHDNHKYVNYSIMLTDVFVAYFLVYILRETKPKGVKYVTFLILTFILTYTGLTEFATFLNKNKNTIGLNPKSELVSWIKENTDKNDVFLTPTWWYDTYFLAGRCTFYGWSGNARNTGYDTVTREKIYIQLLTGCDENLEQFTNICKENNIKYIIETDGLYDMKNDSTNEPYYNKKFMEENLKLVCTFDEQRTRVFQVYED